jgi:hypothetical protein
MLLYSEHHTSRLQYIVDFVNSELLDEDAIAITCDKVQYVSFEGPRINYSSAAFSENEFFIEPVNLLFEKDIKDQLIECFEVNYYKAFFQSRGDLSFDILAAAFYLLSRYEEYLPWQEDEYGRYSHKESLAFREKFLNIPLINIWMKDFAKALASKFPQLRFRKRAFKFLPTYDIDIAYSHLHKGLKRNAGAMLKKIGNGRWKEVGNQLSVLLGKQADPFDSYEWLDSLHLYCRTRAYYFFLMAGKTGVYDKNINPLAEPMQRLISYHANGYTIGIHPSWQSGDEPEKVSEEIEMLAAISRKKIKYSRQHYIRLKLPETYRRLIQQGIEKEFSMGYGSINGFRASVASSFYWFDLEANEATGLKLFPFCFMDANSFYEQKLTPAEGLRELMNYYHSIKKVNGLMISIWHNQFLGTDPQFKGWREVYEVFLKEEVYWDM